MKFTLPSQLSLGVSAGLVIRTDAVEILAMKGRAVTSRVRVAIEGTEDRDLVAAIRRAVETAGLKTKRLAVSIPSQDVLFRRFTVPAVPTAELDAVVQFEVRKYVPFKIETLVWSYTATPMTGSGQLEVVFCAISQELFLHLQDVLASAGIRPILIEPRGVSLARLFRAERAAGSNACICLVEVEPSAAHLTIVKDGVPQFAHNIVFAPTAEAVPPADTASPGADVVPGDGAAVEAAAGGAVPEPHLDQRSQRLLSELSVSINFFLREYPSTTISRIVLVGEEPLVGPWCRWLSEQLQYPVELGSRAVDQRVEGGLPLTFAPALGLLEAARRPADAPLEFLRRAAKSAASQHRPQIGDIRISGAELLAALKRPQGLWSVGLALCVLGGWSLLEGLPVSAERANLQRLIALRPDLSSQLNVMTTEELTAVKEPAGNQLAFLKRLIDQRVPLAAKLDAVAQTLPKGVWLTQVSFEDTLTSSGKSQSHMAIVGACYLGAPDREMSAIRTFEEQVKRNANFLTGFSIAQVDKIDAKETQEQQSYREFQLNCDSGRI